MLKKNSITGLNNRAGFATGSNHMSVLLLVSFHSSDICFISMIQFVSDASDNLPVEIKINHHERNAGSSRFVHGYENEYDYEIFIS